MSCLCEILKHQYLIFITFFINCTCVYHSHRRLDRFDFFFFPHAFFLFTEHSFGSAVKVYLRRLMTEKEPTVCGEPHNEGTALLRDPATIYLHRKDVYSMRR